MAALMQAACDIFGFGPRPARNAFGAKRLFRNMVRHLLRSKRIANGMLTVHNSFGQNHCEICAKTRAKCPGAALPAKRA
eukprot:13300549-Alexandrium_andersonii.AAC.1